MTIAIYVIEQRGDLRKLCIQWIQSSDIVLIGPEGMIPTFFKGRDNILTTVKITMNYKRSYNFPTNTRYMATNADNKRVDTITLPPPHPTKQIRFKR